MVSYWLVWCLSIRAICSFFDRLRYYIKSETLQLQYNLLNLYHIYFSEYIADISLVWFLEFLINKRNIYIFGMLIHSISRISIPLAVKRYIRLYTRVEFTLKLLMKLHNKTILKCIENNRVVTTSEIAHDYKVSWNTAEKYLLEMALDGHILRLKKQGVNLWVLK